MHILFIAYGKRNARAIYMVSLKRIGELVTTSVHSMLLYWDFSRYYVNKHVAFRCKA